MLFPSTTTLRNNFPPPNFLPHPHFVPGPLSTPSSLNRTGLSIQTLNPLTQTPNQKSPTTPKSRTRTLILGPSHGLCNSECTTKSKPQCADKIPEADVPAQGGERADVPPIRLCFEDEEDTDRGLVEGKTVSKDGREEGRRNEKENEKEGEYSIQRLYESVIWRIEEWEIEGLRET